MTIATMGPAIHIRQLERDETRSVKQAIARMGSEVMPEPSEREGQGESEERTKEGCVEFGIEAEGRLVGLVQNYIPNDRMLPVGTYEIGIALFDASARGRGVGTEALRLFIQWLQRERGATRIQAVTALNNQAMRRSLSKLGFKSGDEVMVSGIVETIFALELSRAERAE
jgi:RimJ/RimL family protein N-acetyltransferase